MAKSSKAHMRASHKYTKNNYKKKYIIFKKSEIGTIDKFCKEYNYTRNNLINQSIKEKREIETGKKFEDLVKENQAVENIQAEDNINI